METNTFLFVWDCYGLEYVENLTNLSKKRIWTVLKDNSEPKPLGDLIPYVILRARANPQRNYEIYTVSVDKSIVKSDLIEMFKNDPQGSAELIRERGNKLYSDRDTSKRVIS